MPCGTWDLCPPCPQKEPASPAVEASSLNHCTASEALRVMILIEKKIMSLATASSTCPLTPQNVGFLLPHFSMKQNCTGSQI